VNRDGGRAVGSAVSTPEHTERDPHAEVGGARVTALIGVGAHGVSYAATHEVHGEVEVWRLHPHAITDRLRRRVAALRQLDHDALMPILEAALDASPPHLLVGRA